MHIFIKAKPAAKEEFIRKIDEAHFVVAVKEPPRDGRANWAIERKVAEYFDLPPSRVNIVSGHRTRDKVLEITINI